AGDNLVGRAGVAGVLEVQLADLAVVRVQVVQPVVVWRQAHVPDDAPNGDRLTRLDLAQRRPDAARVEDHQVSDAGLSLRARPLLAQLALGDGVYHPTAVHGDAVALPRELVGAHGAEVVAVDPLESPVQPGNPRHARVRLDGDR